MIRSGWWDCGWLSLSFWFQLVVVSKDIRPFSNSCPLLYCRHDMWTHARPRAHQDLTLFLSVLRHQRAHPLNTCFLELPEVLAGSANSRLSARNFRGKSLRVYFLTSLQVGFFFFPCGRCSEKFRKQPLLILSQTGRLSTSSTDKPSLPISGTLCLRCTTLRTPSVLCWHRIAVSCLYIGVSGRCANFFYLGESIWQALKYVLFG